MTLFGIFEASSPPTTGVAVFQMPPAHAEHNSSVARPKHDGVLLPALPALLPVDDEDDEEAAALPL